MPQIVDIIINRRSGTVIDVGEAQVIQDLRTIFQAQAGEIRLIEGREITETVRAWAAQHGGGERGLIIGGGDGTVLSAAVEMIGTGIPLGVLPLGTNNLFSRQLGFSGNYKKAAAQYAGNTTLQDVDIGRVNEMHFLVGVMFDKSSVHFFEAREKVRDGRYAHALKHMFHWVAGTLGKKELLHISPDSGLTKSHSGTVFAVTNNAIAPRPNNKMKLRLRNVKDIIENMLTKGDLADGKLALYAFNGSLRHMPSIMRSLWAGTWHNHAAMHVQQNLKFNVTRAHEAPDQNVTLVLDGEIKKTAFPLKIEILPKALRVYRPS